MEAELRTEDVSLLRRIEQGNPEATGEFLARYESASRMVIRRHLDRMPKGMNRMLDSADIWQSTAAEFWFDTQAGRIEADSEEELVRILNRMFLDKLMNRYRALTTRRRDVRRTVELPSDAQLLEATSLSNVGDATRAEQQVGSLLDRLPPELQLVFRRRLAGAPWATLAEEAGVSADTFRKKCQRALTAIQRYLTRRKDLSDREHG